MSRVRADCKYMNTCKASVRASKVTRIHSPNEDYHKAKTLSSWLFMKYDMKYSTFMSKSKARKDYLRAEYEEDTKDYKSTPSTYLIGQQ